MANEQAREDWQRAAQSWIRNAAIHDQTFQAFTDAVIEAAGIQSGDRVLDVGCGAGTLLERAYKLGAFGVGVDIAPAMIETAAERFPQGTFRAADAQSDDLVAATEPGFDHVISRFGVMFFEDPIAAFANLRRATRPGGQLTFASWRAEEVEIFCHGLRVLLDKLTSPPALPRPDAPGPLGLGSADRIESILSAAGWQQISLTKVDGVCDYAVDTADGVEERLEIALAGRVGRALRAELEPAVEPLGWQASLDEARDELRTGLVDGRVQIEGHTWLVAARNLGDA